MMGEWWAYDGRDGRYKKSKIDNPLFFRMAQFTDLIIKFFFTQKIIKNLVREEFIEFKFIVLKNIYDLK